MGNVEKIGTNISCLVLACELLALVWNTTIYPIFEDSNALRPQQRLRNISRKSNMAIMLPFMLSMI